MAAIKKYEATSGNDTKPNKFSEATIKIRARISHTIEVIQENNWEHTFRMRRAKSETQLTKEQIWSSASLIKAANWLKKNVKVFLLL